jgi:hypothetical protein
MDAPKVKPDRQSSRFVLNARKNLCFLRYLPCKWIVTGKSSEKLLT